MKTRLYIIVACLALFTPGCKRTHDDRAAQLEPQVDVAGAAHTLMELVRQTSDPDAKWRAIRALGNLRYKHAAPLLIECLKDGHPHVRANAARALGDMRINAASAPLICLLKLEEHGGVIEQTSLALRRLTAHEAVPVLKQVADHNSAQTRAWVLKAIGDLGSRDDVSFLAKRLNASSLSDQQAAARAIENLAEVDFGFPKRSGPYNPELALKRARDWWKQNKTTFVSE